MSNVLEKIVANKRRELVHRKSIYPEKVLASKLPHSTRSFFDALNHSYSDFILECKKASPSKGLIRENFDLKEILSSYSKYASAISVLTDNKYFKGSFFYLKHVSQNVTQPVLAKDFFVDPYQVTEARYYGADAILLMLSVLDDAEYLLLAEKAKSLNLDILTEVHDQQEMLRAINLDAKIIGINNRNLKDLSINLQTTPDLVTNLTEQQKQGRLFISESGISTNQQIRQLSPYVNGFLIGSSIMSEPVIELQCRSLLYGETKVCGLKDLESAVCAKQNGATFGGFIFYDKSPRHISPLTAKKIAESVDLQWVGVFVNHTIEKLIDTVEKVGLSIVQLHGNENGEYIKQLKAALPNIKIWKALAVQDQLSESQIELVNNFRVDRVLLDTQHNGSSGGTGKTFNWDSLSRLKKDHLVLAGGLNKDNILAAREIGCACLDVNSGVETEPGEKSCEQIIELFKTLRV